MTRHFCLQAEARRLLGEKAALMAALQKCQARSEANLQLAAKLEHAIGGPCPKGSRESGWLEHRNVT